MYAGALCGDICTRLSMCGVDGLSAAQCPPPKSLRFRTLHHLPALHANSSVGIGLVNSMDTNLITLCKSTIKEWDLRASLQHLTIISNPRWPYTLFTSFHIIVISYIQESDVNIYTFYTFCIIQLIAWMIGGVDRNLSTPYLHLFWLYLHLFRPVLAENGGISGCIWWEKENYLAIWRQKTAENRKKIWFQNVK